MVKSPYNLNNNWIQEYHDKHGSLPTVNIPLRMVFQGPRSTINEHDQLRNQSDYFNKLKDYSDEDWEELKKSIKKKGLQQKMTVYEDIRKGKVSYFLTDGRHRVCALEELYGLDYVVEVEIVSRRNFTQENRVKIKTINNINLHRESTPHLTKKVQDNLQKQIERKLADIKSKSVNSKNLYTFTKVNKTYKDYL